MELILKRIAKRKTYTIGRLYIREQVMTNTCPATKTVISATRWNPHGATTSTGPIR